MLINNKDYENWEIEEIETLIGDEDYRENEFLDYKKNLAILECQCKDDKKKEQKEFRKDICSFANSSGGYLFIGIEELKGIPNKIVGIDIANKDKFELDRINEISKILPIPPNVRFMYIPYEAKYIVVIRINQGYCKPYVVEENSNFIFCIRRGNGKQSMTYTEIRNQFMQSENLNSAIKKYREERKNFYDDMYQNSPYAIFQIIPEIFIDKEFNLSMYDIHESDGLMLGRTFRNICYGEFVPNVDGISFIKKNHSENLYLQINDNGVFELGCKINITEKYGSQGLDAVVLKKYLDELIMGTSKFYRECIHRFCRCYICISFLNCIGLTSECNWSMTYNSVIDRNLILCNPIEIRNIIDTEEINDKVKRDSFIALSDALSLKRKYWDN